MEGADIFAYPGLEVVRTAQSDCAAIVSLIQWRRSGGVVMMPASASPVARVMTDNGSCHESRNFRARCKALGLKHIKTRP
jgi:transposase InsO family protein